MSQVSPILRRAGDGWIHWCPACEQCHRLPDLGWTFNGDLQHPTFSPSFKHGGRRTLMKEGVWTGEWHRGPDGQPLDGTCHYIITDGKIQFCPDSWHNRSDIVQMPLIPPHLDDSGFFARETQD